MPHTRNKTAVSPAALGILSLAAVAGFGAGAGVVRADTPLPAPPIAEPPAAVSGTPTPVDAAAVPAGALAPVAVGANTAAAPANDPATEDRLKALEDRIRQLTDELSKLKEGQKPEAVGKVVDEKLKSQKPAAGYDNGFYIQSADGNNRFRIKGHLQSVFRASTTSDSRTNIDNIFLRRARPVFEATLQKYIDFRIMPDFGQGATTLFDAYMQLNYLPSAQIRVGKFKEPVSLERIQGAPDVAFVERSIANNLGPNRDVGIQVGGPIFNHRAEYQIGLFDGSEDLGNVDNDGGNDKDVALRLFLTPFHNQEKSPLKELGFGIATTIGSHDETAAPLNYRTAGRASFFKFTAGTNGDGNFFRLAPQMYFYHGPFGLMAEYLTSRQELINGAVHGSVQNRAWFAQAQWVITGEKATFRSVVPKHPFDPKKGTWGAFELAARFSRVNLDDNAFRLGFADPTVSAGSATAFTIGLNWYLNRALKVQLNYEHTGFDRALTYATAKTDHEDVFLANFQIQF